MKPVKGLHIIRIKYWNASGSGFPPSLNPTLWNIGICNTVYLLKVSPLRLDTDSLVISKIFVQKTWNVRVCYGFGENSMWMQTTILVFLTNIGPYTNESCSSYLTGLVFSFILFKIFIWMKDIGFFKRIFLCRMITLFSFDSDNLFFDELYIFQGCLVEI